MSAVAQLQPSPPVSCPDWCDSLHPADWDQLVPSGQIIRGHDIAKYPSVPADAGIRCVEVYAYATEYVDGTPVEVGVCVEATGGNLTADQALEVARCLIPQPGYRDRGHSLMTG